MKFQKKMDVASATHGAPVLAVRVTSYCALDETCLYQLKRKTMKIKSKTSSGNAFAI